MASKVKKNALSIEYCVLSIEKNYNVFCH